LYSVLGQPSENVSFPVLQDQLYSLTQTSLSFLYRLALSVGARHLRTDSSKAALGCGFYDRCKFCIHYNLLSFVLTELYQSDTYIYFHLFGCFMMVP